tara:strand:- start:58 stop:555 length:498 start_codon:yes stop_codon:yes gene_type:complete
VKTLFESNTLGNPRKHLLIPALVILAIDQVTKILAVAKLEDREPIDLFWTLRLNVIRNKGASFSLGTAYTSLLAVVAILAAIAIFTLSKSAKTPVSSAFFGVVLGGVLGNVIDRIFRSRGGFLNGGVVDFIDFQWWPIFNVADMALVVGLPILLILRLREDREDG